MGRRLALEFSVSSESDSHITNICLSKSPKDIGHRPITCKLLILLLHVLLQRQLTFASVAHLSVSNPESSLNTVKNTDKELGLCRCRLECLGGIIHEKAQKYWALREVLGSNWIELDRCLVAMGGLEPPTPAL